MKVLAVFTSAILAAIPAAFAQSFAIIAIRSGSPIHYGQLTANGGSFWIGKNLSTYCPEVVQPNCPSPANLTTAFIAAPGAGTLSLDVAVPGGQQVYVAPNGVLSYTQAHSTFAPPGSVFTGFNKTEGQQFGRIETTGGLVACPTGNSTDPMNAGPWQIYSHLEGLNLPGGCLGFDPTTWNSTKTTVRAWQYA